jgi:hypothetical protein
MQRLRLRSQGDGGLPKARGVGGGPMRQLGNGWYPIEIKDSISPSVGKKRPCNQCCPADSDSVNLGSNPGPPANNGLLISLAFLRVTVGKAGHQGQTAHSGTHGSRHNSDVAVGLDSCLPPVAPLRQWRESRYFAAQRGSSHRHWNSAMRRRETRSCPAGRSLCPARLNWYSFSQSRRTGSPQDVFRPGAGGRCRRTNICARSAGRLHGCERWRNASCRPPARNAAPVPPVSS